MNTSQKTLTVVCPVYNEAEVIELFYESLSKTLSGLSNSYIYKILFVVDKSNDNSLEILTNIAVKDIQVQVLGLSSRFGHQMSLVAGIDNTASDIVIMMDSDLQHPPELIPELIKKYEEGYEVVFTIRQEPKDTSFIKRIGSKSFYKLMSWLAEVPLSSGQADYRLVSKKVADVFKEGIRERNQFLRGLFSWVGFKKVGVEYMPSERMHGSSKYDFSRMYKFALHGITSFSKKPLQYAIFIGIIFSFLALVQIIYVLYQYFYNASAVTGFSTLAILISLFGGIQLIFMGILGEYIGSIFDEVKSRPLYIVEEKININ
jgi:dolichol-phosphate mannosyltransferase